MQIPNTPDQLIGALSEALALCAGRMQFVETELERESTIDRLVLARVLRGSLMQHRGAIAIAKGLYETHWTAEIDRERADIDLATDISRARTGE